MRQCYFVLLFIMTVLSSQLVAADSDTNERLRFGAFAGASANFHSASFGSLSGFPSCCPQYRTGTGLTTVLSLFIEFPLSHSFSHMVRVSLSDLSGHMSSVETEPVIVNKELLLARIQHSLEATVRGVSVEPLLHYRLTRALGLFTGLRFDFSLKGTITQQEELVAPEVGTFENGSRIRNVQQGNIFALTPVVVSAVAGIRVELPMKKDASLLFIPELSMSIGMNTVTGSEEWRVHALRLGASLAFQSPKSATPVSLNTEIPTIQAEITAFPFDGVRELTTSALRLEESETVDIQPLLPYIFFDSNSEALPVRYVSKVDEDIDAFDVQSTVRSTALSSYYSILTVIGKRLRQHNTETIVLTGIVDATEARATEIANRRAANISRYLQKVWGIDRLRIRTQTRQGRNALSTEDTTFVASENHRVEIEASAIVLAPLQRRDTIRSVSPRYIRLRPQTTGTDVTENWQLSLKQRSRLLKNFSGKGPVPFKLSADFVEDNITISSDSIVALLIVNGKTGIATSAAVSIPTEILSINRKHEERLPDTVFVNSQLLFLEGSDMSALHTQQFDILRSLQLKVSSSEITDYSDRSSANATDIVRKFDLQTTTVLQSQAGQSIYSNTFPEGRFYNRSVLLKQKSTR